MIIRANIGFMTLVLLLPIFASAAELTAPKLIQPVLTDNKEGMMKSPQGIACNKEGAFIVADSGNGRLLSYTYKDDVVKGGGEIRPAQLSYPQRVQLNSKGDMYVLDGKSHKIAHLNPQGNFVAFLEPQGIPGVAPVAKSFKIDPEDNIYILDIFSERVLMLDPDGKYLKSKAFPSPHGFITDLAVTWSGDMYLVDSTNCMVLKSAKGADAFTPLTKNMKTDMDFPGYMTIDSKGTIYLVDQDGGGIIALGPDGNIRTRMFSMGVKPGYLFYPGQICLSEGGTLFVADRDNNRVQLFEMPK